MSFQVAGAAEAFVTDLEEERKGKKDVSSLSQTTTNNVVHLNSSRESAR